MLAGLQPFVAAKAFGADKRMDVWFGEAIVSMTAENAEGSLY